MNGSIVNELTPENGTVERQDVVLECERRIGYQFNDRRLLEQGLIHSSCAPTRLECNERMEFLGDAVLGMVICQYLYDTFPEHREGYLTQQKSRLVSRTTCAQVGERLNLKELIFVGKGLRSIPASLVAAGVEAIVAAIYLDGGLEPTRTFILNAFGPELDSCNQPEAQNYKSLLQEETQRDGSTVPRYVILDQRGPDHAREFCIAVEIGDHRFDSAWGKSKKEAEQKAASHALRDMGNTE